MPKKKNNANVPSNKYGLSNLNFGRPGFSLEAPRVNLQKEEKKPEEKTPGKKTKAKTSTTEKKSTSVKTNVKADVKKFNKQTQAVPKMTIRKAAGRGK